MNVKADMLEVTLLGTGTPRPSIERFGPATLIEYKNDKYLFDVGRGATLRLAQLGLNPSDINHLFFTHLHSDHITGYADFWLTGWIWQRKHRLNIYGPVGTSDFVRYVYEAHSKDIEYRHTYSDLPTYNLQAISNDIDEGIILNKNGVKITAFRVDHGGVIDAYGYKFETSNYSVVISGDTTFSGNLVKYAKETDLLIHELAAISPELLDQNPRLKKISQYHTSVEELISVINEVSPKRTILNHLLLIGETERKIESQLSKFFGKSVLVGKDLMRIRLENERVCIDKKCELIN